MVQRFPGGGQDDAAEAHPEQPGGVEGRRAGKRGAGGGAGLYPPSWDLLTGRTRRQVNDMNELNIDADVIKNNARITVSQAQERVVSLSNGRCFAWRRSLAAVVDVL
jgi:hypothetical protein